MALMIVMGVVVLAVVFDIEWLKKLSLIVLIPLAIILFLTTAGVI